MSIRSRYPIPGQTHRVKEEIKRSRFVTTVAHTPTVERARVFVEQIQDEFAEASHHCWAYLVGPPGSTAQIGMSDAGEPHGTAGKPMLMVLLHSGIGDICAVVTRYFGGTLLGKGGLVKAYGGGVQLALESLPLSEKVSRIEVLAVVEYSVITPLQRMLSNYEAELVNEEFAADVTVRIRLPQEHQESFVNSLIDMTKGNVLFEVHPTSE